MKGIHSLIFFFLPRNSRKWLMRIQSGLISLTLIFLMTGCWSNSMLQTNGRDRDDLTELPFEELINIEFITVFKKRAKIFEAPAAVYAISHENIRRAGATNITDILRTVPGIQVSQHDAHSSAITSRGFSGLSRGISGQFANKLLVLNDGRSIYTPLFSGVSWAAQDVLLADTERIEVIRGPGASLWGANAVNGIINIISKNAKDTQGGLVDAGIGTEQKALSHFRYGGNLGGNNYFRVFGKYLEVDNLVDSTGTTTADGWHVLRGGFRIDSHLASNKMLTFEGEIYDGELGQTYNLVLSNESPVREEFNSKTKISGGHILGRWKHSFSNSSDLEFQAYFDRVKIQEAVVRGRIHTYDFDFHHRFALNARQEMIWGAGYRLISDKFDSTFGFSLNPPSRKTHLLSTFLQNETTLIPKHLRLTIGSKFERNDYTGFEFQPSIRLLLTPNKQNALWTAASRAVRTPSRGENDARIVLDASGPEPNIFTVVFGNRDFEPEKLLALGAGYRHRPTRDLILDFATFYNHYDNLRTEEPAVLFREPSGIVVPLNLANYMTGKTLGFEAAADWRVLGNWRVRAAYSHLKIDLTIEPQSQDTFAEVIEEQSPRNQFFVSSLLEPNKVLELDFRFRYVDSLPSLGVPSYATLDLRFGWHVTDNFDFSVIGQNLLQKQHAESSSSLTMENRTLQSGTLASEIQRGLFTKITLQF